MAVKLADVDPAATVTVDGTVRLVLLLLRATAVFTLSVVLNATVQLVLPGVAKEDGLQVRELTVDVAPTVIVPPLLVVFIDTAAGDAALVLFNPIVRVPVEIEGVMETVATTPSAIVEAFKPEATQV